MKFCEILFGNPIGKAVAMIRFKSSEETQRRTRFRSTPVGASLGWTLAALGCFSMWFGSGFWPDFTAKFCLFLGLTLIGLGLVFVYQARRRAGTPVLAAIRFILAVVVVVGIWPAWYYGIKLPEIKSQAWEGRIVRKHRTIGAFESVDYYLLSRSEGGGPPPDPRKKYAHYWDVKTTDSQTFVVKVHYMTWYISKVGEPVRKVRGKRWPEVDVAKLLEEVQEAWESRQKRDRRPKVY